MEGKSRAAGNEIPLGAESSLKAKPNRAETTVEALPQHGAKVAGAAVFAPPGFDRGFPSQLLSGTPWQTSP
jgi:hypothetical protein